MTDTDQASNSQASQLVRIATAQGTFFSGTDGTLYAEVKVGERHETHPIASSDFSRWLVLAYYRATNKAAGKYALHEALAVIGALAVESGIAKGVHVRKANVEGSIFLDLGDPSRSAVKITRDGWSIVTDPPVVFRRPNGGEGLPVPIREASLLPLRSLFPLVAEDDWKLIVAWVLAALGPHRPYPILQLLGEQGSAKSTLARMLRRIVDPNRAALRSLPRDEGELAIAANNALVLAFDNLSRLSVQQSDALCRVSTGGGYSKRKLYTDVEEVVLDVMRPVILTGIDDVVTAPDLMDRTITVRLPAIKDALRLAEEELWQTFEALLPTILGGLCDVMWVGLRNLPRTEVLGGPRLADFTRWITACEPQLGWKRGAFLDAYSRNRVHASDQLIDASPIGELVYQLIERGEWCGTPAQLLKALEQRADAATKTRNDWPSSPEAVSKALYRIQSNLRVKEIHVTRERSSGGGRVIRIYRGRQ